jgi:hypothetical protein
MRLPILLLLLGTVLSGCTSTEKYEPIWLEENRCPQWPRIRVSGDVPIEYVPISFNDVRKFHEGCGNRYGLTSCATDITVYLDMWGTPGHRVRCGNVGKPPPTKVVK